MVLVYFNKGLLVFLEENLVKEHLDDPRGGQLHDAFGVPIPPAGLGQAQGNQLGLIDLYGDVWSLVAFLMPVDNFERRPGKKGERFATSTSFATIR